MKTDVYDSYARDGERVLHFDVLVEHGTTKEQAFDYGQKWLVEIGESPDTLKQSHCNFCHSESNRQERLFYFANGRLPRFDQLMVLDCWLRKATYFVVWLALQTRIDVILGRARQSLDACLP